MNSDTSFRAWATINLQALQSNFLLSRSMCPTCNIAAVVKSNGYGHGMLAVANSLNEVMNPEDCFAVATLEEAISVRNINRHRKILLLEGFRNENELKVIASEGLNFVIHNKEQLQCLESDITQDFSRKSHSVWLKLDSGMHRLGFSEAEFTEAYETLIKLPWVKEIVFMSHLACADSPTKSESVAMTGKQINFLQSVITSITDQRPALSSLAASAGILSLPQSHFQWIRPGIMLYGGSPFTGEIGVDRGLQSVMTLRSKIIAIKKVKAGESIGYGATYTCEKSTPIGVVSIGYGDGYPRGAKNGTPVLVSQNGAFQRTQLIGRVSMDMITIDLSECENVVVGDEVILWGKELSADEVALHCDTVSYELFCRVTNRVHTIYH